MTEHLLLDLTRGYKATHCLPQVILQTRAPESLIEVLRRDALRREVPLRTVIHRALVSYARKAERAAATRIVDVQEA